MTTLKVVLAVVALAVLVAACGESDQAEPDETPLATATVAEGEGVSMSLEENAGTYAEGRGMVWTRTLDVSPDRVWEAVSTEAGLANWWLGGGAPATSIDLQPGGVFQHHWQSTVTDFTEGEFIEFENEEFIAGGMRIEVSADGNGTQLTFVDFLAPQNRPPGAPFAGPAAGWHNALDVLETYLTGKTFEHSMDDLVAFYTERLGG